MNITYLQSSSISIKNKQHLQQQNESFDDESFDDESFDDSIVDLYKYQKKYNNLIIEIISDNIEFPSNVAYQNFVNFFMNNNFKLKRFNKRKQISAKVEVIKLEPLNIQKEVIKVVINESLLSKSL